MFHFISGLPRAGTTLLASILRQNPACHASIMSPVGHLLTSAHTAMGPANEADRYITDDQRRRILRGIVENYYAPVDPYHSRSVIFDNNRRWTANASLLHELFPESKIICCLRTPAAIVDSFERLFQSHPLALSHIYGSTSNSTVYERVSGIMGAQGVLGFALNGLRSAFFGPHRDKLLGVQYDDLCRFPAAVLKDLTEALGLPHHNYNFAKIEQIPGATEFDQDVATPGLHDLKPEVVYEQRPSVLPPDIWNSLPAPFWLVKEGETDAK
jgi:sulfotransferase